jgi:RHS repeat-associated protein
VNVGSEQHVEMDSSGNTISSVQATDNLLYATDDSSIISSQISNDVRFGSLVRVPTSTQSYARGATTIVKQIDSDQSVTYLTGAGPFNVNKLINLMTVNGKTTQVSFDGVQKALEIKSPLGNVTRYEYDDSERITKIQSPGLIDVEINYNSQGQVAYIKQGKEKKDFSYDGFGNVIKETKNNFEINYERDDAGRIIKKTLPNGDFTKLEYTKSGALKKLTTPNNEIHEFQTDLLDQVSSYIAPLIGGSPTSTNYEYNSDGKIKKIVKPSGKFANYSYKSGTNFLEKISTANGDFQFNNIDSVGRQGEVISPDGIRMQLSWIGDKISETKWYDGGNFLGSVVQTYDSNFRVATVTINGVETAQYDYDDDGRLIRAGDESYSYYPKTQHYPYDGRLEESPILAVDEVRGAQGKFGTTYFNINTSLVFFQPDAFAQQYIKGSIEELPDLMVNREIITTQFGNTEALEQFRSVEKIYKDGNVRNYYQDEVFVDGVSYIWEADDKNYSYDVNRRLNQVNHKRRYTVEIDGENIAVVDPPVSTSYTFLGNNNISEYDHAGKKTYATYGAQDRLMKLTGAIQRDFTYTADGDLESISNCLGERRFEYDVFRNLKKVTLPNNKTISYKVDGFNRRVARLVNGAVDEYYLWYDQTRLAAVVGPNGALKIRYIYGAHAIAPIYMIKDGVTYKIFSTVQGSIKNIFTMDGEFVQSLDYDEYGVILQDSSISSPNDKPFQPLGYVSGIADRDTGLTRFGVRDYDPTIGRWTAKDPIGFNGGDTNLYSYVGQNPTTFIDPTGLYTLQIGGAFNYHFLGINFQGGFGVALDTNGGIGHYSYEGGGFGAGATTGFGLSVQASNANNICDLRGNFANSSIHGGAGLGGALDLFSGHALNGTEINGAGITLGAQEGAAVSTGYTFTHVFPWNK